MSLQQAVESTTVSPAPQLCQPPPPPPPTTHTHIFSLTLFFNLCPLFYSLLPVPPYLPYILYLPFSLPLYPSLPPLSLSLLLSLLSLHFTPPLSPPPFLSLSLPFPRLSLYILSSSYPHPSPPETNILQIECRAGLCPVMSYLKQPLDRRHVQDRKLEQLQAAVLSMEQQMADQAALRRRLEHMGDLDDARTQQTLVSLRYCDLVDTNSP